MKKAVIIVAGGKGLRMGGDLPKQFLPLQDRPVLMHTLETFNKWDSEVDLFLVIPEEHESYWKMLCRELNFSIPHSVVYGGETRFHSVRNGLQAIMENSLGLIKVERLHEVVGHGTCKDKEERLREDKEGIPVDIDEDSLIAVHDGVRPFVSYSVISECFEIAETFGAAIPVVPMIESVRVVYEGKSRPFNRNQLYIVQTPQVFRAGILFKAYEQTYDDCFTDDASLVEASGHTIHLVDGNSENIKITTPMDLQYAELTMNNAQ